MVIIENNSTDAAYHFALEEVLVRHIRSTEPVLMLWQTEKTVMLGNNQVADAEVDIDFAINNGIEVVRRSSGGGAIFTDLETVLYTMIEPLEIEAKEHRERTAAKIIGALNQMGVPAVREGRNDILVDGKKISGLAQYTVGDFVCSHGSLLYDADLEMLTSVLIANEKKLHPKGITSIRSRVTNIKPYINANYCVDEFISALKTELLHNSAFSRYELSADDRLIIDRIYHEKYANQAWNFRM